MTQRNKTSLTAVFETGDTPQGGDYADLIDSYLNVVETTAQSLSGALFVPELNSTLVSAFTINTPSFTSTSITGTTITATTFNTGTISASGVVSAASIAVAGAGAFGGAVTGLTFKPVAGYKGTVESSVAATGNTQASAKVVSADTVWIRAATSVGAAINRAVIIDSFVSGRRQVIFNDTNTSAAIYPPTGAQIDGLGANNPRTVNPSVRAMIVHVTSTQYFSIIGA